MKSLLKERKTPCTKARYVGVEIEFISPWPEKHLLNRLRRTGLAKHVQVKFDGSIHTETGMPYAFEVCALATEKCIERVIKRVCWVLISMGCKVNESCGLHVHLDMRTRNAYKSFRKLYHAQAALYSLVRKDRYYNEYCRYRMSGVFGSSNRYLGINTVSYSVRKTIEIRMHEGTLSAAEICNWIKLLLSILSNPKIVEFDVPEYFKRLRMPVSVRDFYLTQ